MPKQKYRPIPDLSERDRTRFLNRIRQGAPDECWPWLGAIDKDGYGIFGFDKGTYRAIRIAVKFATGNDPGDLNVLHSCDRPICTNWNHLSPGTQQKNQAFRIDNPEYSGENHPTSSKKQKEIDAIRAEYSSGASTQEELAAKYGVSQALISKIVRGEIWRLTADPEMIPDSYISKGEKHGRSVLTDAIVKEILSLDSKLSNAEIARRYGVTPSLIGMIRRRKIWRHIK